MKRRFGKIIEEGKGKYRGPRDDLKMGKLWYRQAMVYYAMKKFKDAVKCFEKCL